MSTTGYALTEQDAYYLASIGRMLPASAFPADAPLNVGEVVSWPGLVALGSVHSSLEAACKGIEGVSLGGEIAADNLNYLDCLIDQIARMTTRQDVRR